VRPGGRQVSYEHARANADGYRNAASVRDAQADTVNVKYRGLVELKPFSCTETVSSFVRRVCYDKQHTYMLILLRDTWYHYCEIDAGTVNSLIYAESVGRFFNSNIKEPAMMARSIAERIRFPLIEPVSAADSYKAEPE